MLPPQYRNTKRFFQGRLNGYALEVGLLLRFDYVDFHRHVDGVGAFVDWLCEQKCVDFKYRLGKFDAAFGDEADDL